ncbi:MAG: GntR family transcriptional regulator [Cyanosarcina radialis HA8281-LM2]|nr:GntR family transcriptional regulator [Cyanosarcina radialis HA8281-LM2]
MVQFHIQLDSEVPASKQLFDQIQFAIASGQYPPGHRLPSTRQLALQTGLHRNTISKVYKHLEETGMVDSLAGSGIYVREKEASGGNLKRSPILDRYPEANKIVQQSLDRLLEQGYSLWQARELLLAEIDWRLRCSAQVLVTVPSYDLGAGELIVQELQQSLTGIPLQLVPLDELQAVLAQTKAGTVVTSRYFLGEAEAIANPQSVRVIPLDIHDYQKELQLVEHLPQDSCVGIVSLSSGILQVAEIIINSLRGEELLVMTSRVTDTYKLQAIVRSAHIILSDRASFSQVRAAVEAAREDIIRPPQIIKSENYVDTESIDLLKRELGLT